MRAKLMIFLLSAAVCLMGITPALALKNYNSLAEYEELTGNKIESFNQAPMFSTMVTMGKLPPLEERMPEEDLMVVESEEIGQYGGTLWCPGDSPTKGVGDVSTRVQPLVMVAPDLQTIIPNVIKGWEFSEDLKTLTFNLRKGLRWSDGVLFTADDFLFWCEDMLLNEKLATAGTRKTWSPGGEMMKVEKVDNYTVKFEFAVP